MRIRVSNLKHWPFKCYDLVGELIGAILRDVASGTILKGYNYDFDGAGHRNNCRRQPGDH